MHMHHNVLQALKGNFLFDIILKHMKTNFIYKIKCYSYYLHTLYKVYMVYPYQRVTRWYDDIQLHHLWSTVRELYILWIEKILDSKSHIKSDRRADMISIIEDLKSPFPNMNDYKWSREKWLKEDIYNHQLKIRKALKKAADLNWRLWE